MSFHGATFYGLEPSEDLLVLGRGEPRSVAASLDTDEGPVTVFDPARPLRWSIQ